jgi:hypothetical protein
MLPLGHAVLRCAVLQINITVPMTTSPSLATQMSKLSTKSSRSSITSSSSITSVNSVAALLHGVACNLQQGSLTAQSSSPFAKQQR